MMRFYTNVLGCLAVGVTAVTVCRAQAPLPNENGLWLVWMSHTNAVTDHVAIAEAWQAFRTKAPADPLAVVAQGMEAWHLLQAGKTNDAARLLEPMVPLSGDALHKAGADMARGWLTRLDRELVRAALKRVYLRDVEFPASLEGIKTLKVVTLPPFTDRWNQPWSYRPDGLPTIKGTMGQRYVLESARLGASSDLAEALAVPYASRITIEPVRIIGSAETGESVEFSSSSRKSFALTVGTEMDGITFAFIGKNIIVLADKDHWRVVPKPR